MSGKPNVKIIDLFAGIGGIRLGFQQGVGPRTRVVFVSEFDEKANKVYRDNFHDEKPIKGDITKIEENDVPPFDICLAGFPCQAFSIAGNQLGFNDNYKGMSRGTLFYDVIRICAFRRPKVIFCENVKNLQYHDSGRTYKVIKGAFEQIGYTVYQKILKSSDFGVPQKRERIYIVCIRNDINPLLPDDDFPWPDPIVKPNNTIQSILEPNPVSPKYYLSNKYLACLRRHKKKHKKLGHGFGYVIRDVNGLSGTLVCGGMGKERNLIVDTRQTNLTPVTKIHGHINKKGIRKLTPREWANLQGFPQTFVFNEGDSAAYKQLGNTVTVPVIAAIAAQIKKILKL
jgi:DNA-cytosine methyltransferase